MAAIEERVVDVENGHATATEEALSCCGRFDDDALRKRVNEAVAEFLGNVTTSTSQRDAELRSWLGENFLSREDMQRQLEKVINHHSSYRVTYQVVSNLPLTPKQKFHFNMRSTY